MEIDKKRIAELVVRLQGGDEAAFNELYNLTCKRAYFIALEFVKNEHDAEDILQESYVKALSKINELDKPESFSSWLNQIVANKSKDFLKKKKPTVFEAEEHEVFEVIPDEDTEFNPEDNVDRTELQKTVMEVLDELSEEKRACVLMMYFEELSVGEIAETLEIPEGTVKTRLFSARKDLKEKFAKRGITSTFSVAPIGLVIWALRNASGTVGTIFAASGASAKVMAGVSAASAAATTTVAATSATSAAAATGSAGAKVAAMSTAQKVVAGVSAVAVATGAVGGTVALINANTAFYEKIEWSVATSDMLVLESGAIIDFTSDISGNIEIPEEIDGEEIVKISDGAFEDCDSLTAVKIPSTVSHIGNKAFNYCDNLETVWLDSNDCVMWVGLLNQSYAFSNNEKLVNFVFGEDVTSIPGNVCNGVTNLERVVFLGEVTSIGGGAFSGCAKLEEIDFSAVKEIGSEAFAGCAALKDPEFSENLEKIYHGAFNGCTSFKKIEIPQSVRDIESGAFNNCENLETVYFNSNDCAIWPALLNNAYPFENNEKLTEFVFGKGVTSVPANVCNGVTNLETVVFHDEVTSIGSGAFSGCAKLEEIDLSAVKEIGSEAFAGCAALKDPGFSENLEKIGYNAFNGCASFQKIEIPQSVGEIESGAFNNCENLETVYFNSNDCAVWPTLLNNSYPFENNEKLTEFIFGKEVTSVSGNICYGVTNLRKVVFEGEVTEIKSDAFEGCDNITDVQFACVSENEWNSVIIEDGNESIVSKNIKYRFGR